ncbi:deoxyribonuclease-1-like isoform X4 [Ostrea edulis]|uniref:deoxyribonuclease-1-like isoform X4 n=1 Tax=Ostrea edulis TaxID=37623 RepID=UPI0020943867|nr:deoxyribonuclease-1-like isoform X4 [Ostrea edulis]XP_055998060.1 deoxyribonuclease-1-like isoform X4 [Ostrea edulis]
MWRITCVVLYFGLLAVEGSLSELDDLKDRPPIRIGAFNIQIFGETKFNKPGVVQELIKILSRYDIVLVQEIRDSSETYIYRLVDEANNSTRTNEPFSLVVSERLGRTSSKEQYAFLYREKFVNKVDVYQYADPFDIFQRPPYAVKFHSDVLEMHEFGIIGLHTSPEDAFKEINALDVVYAAVEKEFNTPNILIAGDLNADCSYLSQSKMTTLSIRKDTSYTWLIKDAEDTTVSGTDCAYDRFIVKGNSFLDHIIPNSVRTFYYDVEHQLPADLASDVSDHYPIEMEIRGKCNRVLMTNIPSFTVTVEDERIIPSQNLNYIRHIYQKTEEKIPTWSAQVYKIDTRMNYVKATKTNVDVTKAIEEIFQFYEAFDREILSLESIASVWKLLEGFGSFREPYIYCLDTRPVSAVDLTVSCSLVEPLICKIDVSRYLA